MAHSFLRVTLAAALAAAGVSAQRGAMPAQTPQVLTPGSAFILGRVLESGANAPVADATVTLNGAALGSRSARFSDGVDGGQRSASTDAQGNFLFRDLPKGTYQLAASAAGFVNGAYGQGRPQQMASTLDTVHPVDLADGEKLAGLAIGLWKKARIGGIVTDEAGEPMSGVTVTIFHRLVDWAGAVMSSAFSPTTDDRGMYHVDVIPGDYVVAVLAPSITMPASLADQWQEAQAQGPAATRAYTDMLLASGVSPRTGVGMRVERWFVTAPGRGVVPPVASQDGLLRLYATTYYPDSPSPSSAAILSLGSGDERTGVNLELRPQVTHRLIGRLIGPGGPVANIGVRLLVPDPAAIACMNPISMADAPQAVTDASGSFAFIGVVAGSYTLRVFKASTGPGDPMFWAVEPVTIGDADITDHAVTLRTGAKISGHVSVEGSAQPPSAAALSSITTAWRAIPGSNGALASDRAPDITVDPSGTFATPPLVPGAYMLVVSRVPAGWALKSATAGGRTLSELPFELMTSDIDDAVVTITDRVSRVSGVVRDADGKPVLSATVGVFPVDKALWRRPGMPSPRVQTAAPGRDGRYSLTGLPSGEYFIVATDASPLGFADPNVLTSLMASANRLSILEADVKTQDLRVVVIK